MFEVAEGGFLDIDVRVSVCLSIQIGNVYSLKNKTIGLFAKDTYFILIRISDHYT